MNNLLLPIQFDFVLRVFYLKETAPLFVFECLWSVQFSCAINLHQDTFSTDFIGNAAYT